ncbi:metabolite traffic protein EboE [Metapseudomonas otitidis]|uniref:metabolite traffic protein EboE n=1 Tax=Metapseudomonas otitidis TaxID=319939 RepID=UPI0040556AD1
MNGAMGWTPAQLGYCGNVHPAHDLEALCASISGPFQAVRRQRGLAEQDSGLWISAHAASELQVPARRRAFLALLRRCGLRLTSLNGFPFGRFHGAAVKAEVYQPDWADPRRLAYSLQLAELLAEALPEDCNQGVISSVPLGYRAHWTPARQQHAENRLRQLTRGLAELRQRTGKHIRLCLEMEPDCVLERTEEALDFFTRWRDTDPNWRYLALCVDVCHQAVLFEEVGESLVQLHQAGIPVGKIQLSNALACQLPIQARARALALERLAGFAEGVYLHQVKGRRHDGGLSSWADLPLALADPALHACVELRVHFHVPLFTERFQWPELHGTQAALHAVFDTLAAQPGLHPVLEVETYSWNVLPEALRPASETALAQGIAAELAWVDDQLVSRFGPALRRRAVRHG